MNDYPKNNNKLDRRNFLRALSGGALVVASGGLLSGCGGASNGKSSLTSPQKSASGSARAALKITWPARSTSHVSPRLIPVASNAINIDIVNGTTAVISQVVSRPTDGTNTSTVTFDTLPVGNLTVTASAYPDAGPVFGTAQATGTGTLVTQAGQTATLAITMASTIATITVTPTSATVAVGATTTLAASCLDATGAVVLVTPATLQWSSDTPAVATVDSNRGIVTGVGSGSANITVTETESSKTSTQPATVTINALDHWYLTTQGIPGFDPINVSITVSNSRDIISAFAVIAVAAHSADVEYFYNPGGTVSAAGNLDISFKGYSDHSDTGHSSYTQTLRLMGTLNKQHPDQSSGTYDIVSADGTSDNPGTWQGATYSIAPTDFVAAQNATNFKTKRGPHAL